MNATAGEMPKTYAGLLSEVQPRKIEDDAEYQRQLMWVRRIMSGGTSSDSADINALMDLLGMTIAAWEEEISPSSDPDPIGVLGHLLAERNISQTQLAKELGVARQYVNAIMNGKRDITVPIAIRLGELLKMPPETFYRPKTLSAKAG